MNTVPAGTPAAEPELRALLPGLLLADPSAEDERRTGVRRSPRDWFVDVLCVLVGAAIGLAAYDTAMNNDPPELVQLVDLIVGGLACLALWWRRRFPVQLAVTMAVISCVVASAAGAGAIMLLTVAIHRRFAVTAVVAGLHLVSGLIFYRVYPDQDLSWRLSWAFTAAGVVVLALWGMFIRSRRQLVLSLRERTHQAEAEAALRIERARHLERERIAREMHDVLAHRISLLSVHAGALEYRPGAPEEDIVRAASVIRASAHQALQDLREIIGVLRAPSSDDGDPDRPQPTLAQLPALVDESRQAGMRVTLRDLRSDHGEPPSAVARCAYRVVQEGLTNARKHARGTGVCVTLEGGSGDGLAVEIRNRLPVGSATAPALGSSGPAAALGAAAALGPTGYAAGSSSSRATGTDIPGTGTGLIGLTERVNLAGGRLEHGRTADGDFRVFAWLPWPA